LIELLLFVGLFLFAFDPLGEPEMLEDTGWKPNGKSPKVYSFERRETLGDSPF
jgi:hypothetical protein